MVNTLKKLEVSTSSESKNTTRTTYFFLKHLHYVFRRLFPEMAPVGTDPAPFLDWGGESRLVTSFTSPDPGWHGIGGMTEDYTKIGTALARGS